MSFAAKLLRPKVKVEICGAYTEGLINAAAEDGIKLRQLHRKDRFTLSALIYEKDMKRLEMLCRRCMCELKTESEETLRSVLLHRVSLAAALMLMLSVLAVGGFFIWDIDVPENAAVSKGEILRVLADSGLHPGSFRPNVDTELVRSRALPQLPELSWIGISLKGSRAEISLLERENEPELFTDETHTDIIADKDGLVLRLSVLSGTAAVSPGDAVRRGSVLVYGMTESLSGETQYVRSLADAEALTWYELSARAPAEMNMKTRVSGKRDRFSLLLGKNRINFYFSGGNDIDECDKIIYEYKIGVEGIFSLPITLLREHLTKYDVITEQKLNIEDMKARLYEVLREECRGEIQSFGWSCSEHDGTLTVTLRAQCLENIASERKSP